MKYFILLALYSAVFQFFFIKDSFSSQNFFKWESQKETLSEYYEKIKFEKQLLKLNDLYLQELIQSTEKKIQYDKKLNKNCQQNLPQEKILICMNDKVFSVKDYSNFITYYKQINPHSKLSSEYLFNIYLQNEILYDLSFEAQKSSKDYLDFLVDKTLNQFFLNKILNEKMLKFKKNDKAINIHNEVTSLIEKNYKHLSKAERKSLALQNYLQIEFFQNLQNEYRILKNDEWEENAINLFIHNKYREKDYAKWLFRIFYTENKNNKKTSKLEINIKDAHNALKWMFKAQEDVYGSKKMKKNSKNKLREDYLKMYFSQILFSIYLKEKKIIETFEYKNLKTNLRKKYIIDLYTKTFFLKSSKKVFETIENYKEKKNIYIYDANLLN